MSYYITTVHQKASARSCHIETLEDGLPTDYSREEMYLLRDTDGDVVLKVPAAVFHSAKYVAQSIFPFIKMEVWKRSIVFDTSPEGEPIWYLKWMSDLSFLESREYGYSALLIRMDFLVNFNDSEVVDFLAIPSINESPHGHASLHLKEAIESIYGIRETSAKSFREKLAPHATIVARELVKANMMQQAGLL